MKDTEFQVKIGCVTSDPRKLMNGIIQGSVISCSLFLVTINKMFAAIGTEVEYIFFADDLTIFLSHKNLETLQNILQNVLNRISIWCKKVGSNLAKTKV